jgi:hypothetical protein
MTNRLGEKRATKTLADLKQFVRVFLKHMHAGHEYYAVADELGIQFKSVITRVRYLRLNDVELNRDTPVSTALRSLESRWHSKQWKSYRALNLSIAAKK